MRRARLPAPLALTLVSVLLLPACRGRNSDEAALAELRARVDKLESEGAAERQRQAGELAAMRADVDELRASLDAADQRLAELGGQENATAPRPARKSPRASLRNSLHEMYESSRRALDRLGTSLDKSLHRSRPGASPAANATDSPGN